MDETGGDVMQARVARHPMLHRNRNILSMKSRKSLPDYHPRGAPVSPQMPLNQSKSHTIIFSRIFFVILATCDYFLLSTFVDNHRAFGSINELNHQITNLKMAASEETIRRDSGNSTISTCNMSMKSSDFDPSSRKGSQMSQVRQSPKFLLMGIVKIRKLMNFAMFFVVPQRLSNASTLYDPISVGSSRRSSPFGSHTAAHVSF